MIRLQQLGVQLFAVIVHDHQVFLGRRFDDRGREGVLGETELGLRARIVARIIGEVAVHAERLDGLAKILEPVFEARNAKGWRAVGSSAQNVHEEPKAGDEGDDRKRDNCELMTRQADQFNTYGPTGRCTPAMLVAPSNCNWICGFAPAEVGKVKLI